MTTTLRLLQPDTGRSGVIDFYASHVHYLEHLAPIWRQLPPDVRGEFLAGAGLTQDRALVDYGIETSILRRQDRTGTRAVVAASYGDFRAVGERPVIFLEHGAGQTYGNPQHSSHPGGKHRAGIIGYLAPNDTVAEANLTAYPTVPNFVVGIPKLDQWHANPPEPWTPSSGRPPTIAVSFTWNRPHDPESKSAYPHYVRYLHRLARTFPGALAHGHPRIFPELVADYRRFGFQLAPRFSDVLDHADIYICDNSSTIYEFASTGRPVVVLNAPWYRRHIEHGLRFWEYADVGLQVDHPTDLIDTVHAALTDPTEVAERRETIINSVYSHIDGNAAKRSAEAIMALINSSTVRGGCPVCGSSSSTCSRGHRLTGEPVDFDPSSTKGATTMQQANATYRVKRVINGHLADVKVTRDELTEDELETFGLKAADPKKDKSRRPDKNKGTPPPDDNDSDATPPSDDESGESAATPTPPAKSANKGEWEAYAAEVGVDITDEDGNTVTKDRIIELVGA